MNVAPDTLFALEITSTGIVAGAEDATAVTCEPAAARVEGDAIRAGWAAYAAETPAPVWHDFWERLSREPLPDSGANRVLARSILAYNHLEQAIAALDTDPARASFAVALAPSILEDDERTGLFLSMAKSQGLRLRGLLPVPLALAAGAAAALPAEGSFDILDLDAGQWTLFSLRRDGDLIRPDTAVTTREGRLQVLREHFFDALSVRFLAETAFDVRHNAGAEALFRVAVNRFLARDMGEGEHTLDLATRKARSITVSRAAARELAADLPRRVIGALGLDDPGRRSPLYVSHRAHHLPGLIEALAKSAHRSVALLPLETAIHGAARSAAHWPVAKTLETTPEFREIRIPGAWDSAREPSTPIPSAPPQAPTHVVWRGLVHPLDHPALPFSLPVHGGRLSHAEGIHVNGGEARALQPLKAGDRLEMGNETFLLARMAPA